MRTIEHSQGDAMYSRGDALIDRPVCMPDTRAYETLMPNPLVTGMNTLREEPSSMPFDAQASTRALQIARTMLPS